jgi:hypothetical protein
MSDDTGTVPRTVRDVMAAAAQAEFEGSLTGRREVAAAEGLGYRIAAEVGAALRVAGVPLDLDAVVTGPAEDASDALTGDQAER